MNCEEAFYVSRVRYESNGVELEGLVLKPDGAGPFPSVVFIHGHKSNAWQSSWIGYQLFKAGFAVFLPTQLGYKFSGGVPDYCGPNTIRGVLDGVEIFKKEKFVESDHLGIWGISRGATIAALLSTKQTVRFKVAVLQSGIYDFNEYLLKRGDKGIAKAILTETDGTFEALSERSVIEKAGSMSCPCLILHGELDERIPSAQAKLLSARLNN